jgi:surfeit locus 1 family protein
MYFRPFPILTIIAVPALAILCWLGTWQAGRAGWKAGEISAFSDRAHAPPMALEAACAQGLATQQIITEPWTNGPELRVFGHQTSGAAGWQIFQAGKLCGDVRLVQTGFEPIEIGGGMPPGVTSGKTDRFILAPWPEPPFMAAPNAPERNEWQWFDAPEMAKAVNQVALKADFIVLPLEGMPDCLTRTPPETHVGYAVTWFGMAIAFAVIYGLMHARAGRLRFGRKKDGKASQ